MRLLRWRSRNQAFTEREDGLELTMLRIPAGRFRMGSPEDEPGTDPEEGPPHEVTLGEFLMARGPITQAQWRAVATWQPREGERWQQELNPRPSRFQGEEAGLQEEAEANTDQRPVEKVSWHDAMAFCRRLSTRTERSYTLPSEAQWEYACRAGTTTPFAFGTTISPELANYRASVSYRDGATGEDRQHTTPVGHFPAKAWGLQDMHGNVWEWCLDHWHENYEGAPRDGSESLVPQAPENVERVLRGGAWSDPPVDSRLACRYRFPPAVDEEGFVGFHVVCLSPSTISQKTSLHPLAHVYVSYNWGDGTEEGKINEIFVDQLCRILQEQHQIAVSRDKPLLETGDSISPVGADISGRRLVLAVISRQHLRSEGCMIYELLQAFRRSSVHADEFTDHVLALILEDAMEDIQHPSDLFSFWANNSQKERQHLQLTDTDRKSASHSWLRIDKIEELCARLPDLIKAVRISAIPRGDEAIRREDLSEICELVSKRVQTMRVLS